MKYLNAKCPIFLMEALIIFSRRLGAIFKWPVSFCLCGSHKQKLAIVLCELTGIRAAYTAIGLNFSGALWRLVAVLLWKDIMKLQSWTPKTLSVDNYTTAIKEPTMSRKIVSRFEISPFHWQVRHLLRDRKPASHRYLPLCCVRRRQQSPWQPDVHYHHHLHPKAAAHRHRSQRHQGRSAFQPFLSSY